MRPIFLAALLAALFVLAAPGSAADWNIRPWDTQLTPQEARTALYGQSITFPDGATATYETNGAYSYTYQGGNSFTGTWEMSADGAVCTTFDNGSSRCDLYVRQGETLMLINESGGRFLTAE